MIHGWKRRLKIPKQYRTSPGLDRYLLRCEVNVNQIHEHLSSSAYRNLSHDELVAKISQVQYGLFDILDIYYYNGTISEKEAKFLVLEEGCNRRTSAVLLHIDYVQSVPREHPRSSLLPAAGCPCRSMQPQGQS